VPTHTGLKSRFFRHSLRDRIPIDIRSLVNRSMSDLIDTRDAAKTIELGPILGDTAPHSSGTVANPNGHSANDTQNHGQSSQVGDEMTSDEKVEHGTKVIGDDTNTIPREAMEPSTSRPPSRLSPQRTRSGVETVDRREKGSSEQKGSNAMLNLPPPLPFDLKVSNLWVGVPHSGPSRFVPGSLLSSEADS